MALCRNENGRGQLLPLLVIGLLGLIALKAPVPIFGMLVVLLIVLSPIIFIGAMVWLFSSRGKRPVMNRGLSEDILKDACRFDLRIPSNGKLHRLLGQVYFRYNDSVNRYPALREYFDSVMDGLWQNLVSAKSISEWIWCIQRVLYDWPVDGNKSNDEMSTRIRQAKEAVRDWKSARKEAFGGTRI